MDDETRIEARTTDALAPTAEQVLASAGGAVVATDRSGRIAFWNRAATELYGWEPAEVLGRNVFELLVPEPLEYAARTIMDQVGSGEMWADEFQVRHRDGSLRRVALVDRPILDQNGGVVGIVGVGHALPDMDATAERDRLLETERQARRSAEVTAERFARLLAVTTALAAAATPEEVYEAVVSQAVSAAGARAGTLVLLDPAGNVAVARAVGYPDAHVEAFRTFRASDPYPLAEALRTGQRITLNHREMAARYPQLAEMVAGNDGSSASLPLLVSGRFDAAIGLTFETAQPFDGPQLVFLDAIASQFAGALQRARLHEETTRLLAERTYVAARLQASLLPPVLPTIPRVEVAARYLPAGRDAEVGGDFYDAFRTPAGRWLLCVGDVRGKGIDAAAITGLARHAMRSAALAADEPSTVLAHLNALLVQAEAGRLLGVADDDWTGTEPHFCTACAVTLDCDGDAVEATISSGGHPLPVLLTARGDVIPVGRAGSLLGVLDDVALSDTTCPLRSGDTLVLYTDGIVERHEGSRFFDDAGLAEVLRSCSGETAEAVAAALEEAARNFVAGDPADDMAILVVRAL